MGQKRFSSVISHAAAAVTRGNENPQIDLEVKDQKCFVAVHHFVKGCILLCYSKD